MPISVYLHSVVVGNRIRSARVNGLGRVEDTAHIAISQNAIVNAEIIYESGKIVRDKNLFQIFAFQRLYCYG